MGKRWDGTVPRFFVPVPLVSRDTHAGQSRENFSGPARPEDFSPGPGPTGHKSIRTDRDQFWK